MRKPPRWATPFLRSLERTGCARAAAEDAGVDHSTAYARRKSHAEFARQWEAALAAQAAAKKRADEEKIAAIKTPPLPPIASQRVPPSPPRAFRRTNSFDGASRPAPPAEGGGAREDLVVCGNQLKRANGERWGKRKEEAFLAELAVCGNFRRASKTVGISYEAVRKRRRNDPGLEASCQAAIAACQARIPEFLASAAARTFDPDDLPGDASALPKVTVTEAIRIAEMKGRAGAAGAGSRAVATDKEVCEALAKRLAEFGLRVANAEDAWGKLKESGVDPHRLGQIGEVVISAKWANGDSRTDACPHCGQTFQVSFGRAARGGDGGG